MGGVDADKQRKGKDAGKEKGGLGLFGALSRVGVGFGAALFPSSLGDGTRENYKPDISAEQLERLKQEEFFLKQLEKDEELRKKYESIGNIPEQNKFFREYMNNFLTTATESQVEEYNKVKEDSEKLIQEKADKALREIKPIDSIEFDSLVDESGETLDKLGKSFKKLAEKLSKNDFIKEITNALTSIGTLKFADGEVNLFKGAGDVLSSAYKEATSLFADATEKSADQSGQMNTQVNNTNVIGGQSGSSPVYFPNATAIDGHSSLSRFLQSSGAIR